MPALLFGLAIFVNAGLLFWLEPLFAKLVLPLLGGAPAVWNTCLVFYQLALLAGYLWAHVGPRLGARTHAGIHFTLILAGLALLPFGVPSAALPPSFEAPLGWLLLVLSIAIGLPFFLAAANGPLLQRWFAGSRLRGAQDPYFLYAASNFGSAAALLLFPLFFERAFTLAEQARAWKIGYIANMALLGGCAVLAFRSRVSPGPADGASREDPVRSSPEEEVISWRLRGRWTALAAVPSSLMLGVTTYLSTEIAAIPLIWIVPLALYLTTLVLAFANVPGLNGFVRAVLTERLSGKVAQGATIIMAAATAAGVLLFSIAGARVVLVGAHLLLFATAAMLCHAQLADLRPRPAHITQFYFWLGVGGALGGIFNALLGPRLFTSVLEYPLALAAVIMLLPSRHRGGVSPSWADFFWPAALGVVGMALPFLLRLAAVDLPFSPRLLLALPAAGCLAFSGRPLRFGLGIAAVVLVSATYPSEIGRVVHADRNFYGVHRVLDDDAGGFTWLTHGTTVHGGQRTSERRDPAPLTYYHPDGPLGDVFGTFTRQRRVARIAVIGLGAGSMAYYGRGRSGLSWTFYEIDPAVVAIAQDPRYFTFLESARPAVRVVLGDARLTLASEVGTPFDMIVLDAFGSDAIPVHLLTREAMRVYLDKLAPSGLLVMHLSNRFLDLTPVATGLAQTTAMLGVHRVDLDENEQTGKYRSHWAVLSRDSTGIDELIRLPEWQPLRHARVRIWTDDYSSILPLFRRAGGDQIP